MPTQVAYTSSYNVHVVVQPRGLTCSVSNGIGMMPAGTVANVAVNCSVNTYTIGGAISGLTATGLVLLNNGGDATPIAANAIQFTMHTGVVLAGTYAITAQTQPTDQTCTINNAGGSPVFADVWSIAIACAPWTYTISVLHTFGAFGDGAGPNAGLSRAATAISTARPPSAAANSDGTVFKITPRACSPPCTASRATQATGRPSLRRRCIQGSDGNFYGTTEYSGGSGHGTVFKITPAGVLTTLYSFTGNEATAPIRRRAGAGQRRQLLRHDPGRRQQRPARSSRSPRRARPPSCTASRARHRRATLRRAGSRAATATSTARPTSAAAATHGTVFQITPAGVLTTLYSFTGTAATGESSPLAALVQGSDGNFYGTTSAAATAPRHGLPDHPGGRAHHPVQLHRQRHGRGISSRRAGPGQRRQLLRHDQ